MHFCYNKSNISYMFRQCKAATSKPYVSENVERNSYSFSESYDYTVYGYSYIQGC